jgi:hypothetical protein
MSGRPNPDCASLSGLLRNVKPPAAPNPTAGSVIGITTGRKPYFSSRKPLTSTHPSSAEKNLDGEAAASGGFVAVSCAHTDAPENATANRIISVRGVRIVLSAGSGVAHESSSLKIA